ncbi:hypothetical protein B0H12DRAFT_1245069 [Mycena haematopus]|nr:hypothetical protein B0H12DRAFT_1245069 [Mycena haematopus]
MAVTYCATGMPMVISLGSFDGRVGAVAHLGAEHYFITTHADYIPALPSLKIPHALFLRSDMRYGTDDPTLWPQRWEARYCHFPAIARRGTRSELNIMWWDPGPQDFIHGTAITKGLGTLSTQRVTQLLKPINALVGGATIYTSHPRSPTFHYVPTTYTKMVFGVTSLQRAFLELDALYNYMTIYKPRIDNYMICKSTSAPIADCRKPYFGKIAAIQREADTNPWYYDPFDTHPPRSLSPSPALQSSVAIPVASGSRTIPPVDNSSASSSHKSLGPRTSSSRASNHIQLNQARHQRPRSRRLIEINSPSSIPEMPPSIDAWAAALAQVDRSVAPVGPVEKRYVLPEPALLVNTTYERRRSGCTIGCCCATASFTC